VIAAAAALVVRNWQDRNQQFSGTPPALSFVGGVREQRSGGANTQRGPLCIYMGEVDMRQSVKALRRLCALLAALVTAAACGSDAADYTAPAISAEPTEEPADSGTEHPRSIGEPTLLGTFQLSGNSFSVFETDDAAHRVTTAADQVWYTTDAGTAVGFTFSEMDFADPKEVGIGEDPYGITATKDRVFVGERSTNSIVAVELPNLNREARPIGSTPWFLTSDENEILFGTDGPQVISMPADAKGQSGEVVYIATRETGTPFVLQAWRDGNEIVVTGHGPSEILRIGPGGEIASRSDLPSAAFESCKSGEHIVVVAAATVISLDEQLMPVDSYAGTENMRAIACHENIVAAASTAGHRVHVFEVTPSGGLEERRSFDTSRGPTGLAFSSDGHLFIASRPWE